MTLDEEISSARMKVHTDAYTMSIGELVNLYEDGELEIQPNFQRVYRWNEYQKSRLIESIFLGIPLPSIFVAQRKDGVWDVVDGLQRLSTIFLFMGKLRGEKDKFLILEKTKYLPNLAKKTWNDIGINLQRYFKREKIDIKIIKKESETDTKLELFQRLNTGGSQLSDQEVRNCILLMINQEAFNFIKELAANKDFQETLPISDKKEAEAFLEELVIRYFSQRYANDNLKRDNLDIGDYLDAQVIHLFSPENQFPYHSEKGIFNETFSLLNKTLGEDSFRKYHEKDGRYKGAVSVPIFECIALAVSKTIENNQPLEEDKIKKASEKLPELPEFKNAVTSNMRPIDRMGVMEKIALEIFK